MDVISELGRPACSASEKWPEEWTIYRLANGVFDGSSWQNDGSRQSSSIESPAIAYKGGDFEAVAAQLSGKTTWNAPVAAANPLLFRRVAVEYELRLAGAIRNEVVSASIELM